MHSQIALNMVSAGGGFLMDRILVSARDAEVVPA